MKIEPAAIIFDFDGVMFDTEMVHGQAFVDTLNGYGVTLDLNEAIREFVGHNDRAIIKKIPERHAPLETVSTDVIAKEKTKRYAELTAVGMEPLNGLREFIAHWQGRTKMGVCSGSRTSEIERLLKMAGLRDSIETIVSSDDVHASKPDPEGYLRTRDLLANGQPLSCGECLVFEDSIAGVAAAMSAGMCVVGMRSSYLTPSELKAPVVIDDFAQLAGVDEQVRVFRAAGLQ